jgi:large subunit ribosomal protein L18
VIKKESKNKMRKVRHLRVRRKLAGTPERPRLSIYRSLNNMYAQIIDDTTGKTLVSASTLDKEIMNSIKFGGNKEAAKLVGQLVAKRALDKGINSVVFDRGGYIYHGRVKELAEGAREAGLQF